MVSLGIFSVVPPTETEPCAPRSTQPLKMSTRDFSWGKGGRCVWLTTYHPCIAKTSRKSGALIYPEPLGPPRPVAGDFYFYFTNGSMRVVAQRITMYHITTTSIIDYHICHRFYYIFYFSMDVGSCITYRQLHNSFTKKEKKREMKSGFKQI